MANDDVSPYVDVCFMRTNNVNSFYLCIRTHLHVCSRGEITKSINYNIPNETVRFVWSFLAFLRIPSDHHFTVCQFDDRSFSVRFYLSLNNYVPYLCTV